MRHFVYMALMSFACVGSVHADNKEHHKDHKDKEHEHHKKKHDKDEKERHHKEKHHKDQSLNTNEEADVDAEVEQVL